MRRMCNRQPVEPAAVPSGVDTSFALMVSGLLLALESGNVSQAEARLFFVPIFGAGWPDDEVDAMLAKMRESAIRQTLDNLAWAKEQAAR